MAWPSFTSTNTPVRQLCVPLTQALKWRFGNPKFSTSEKQRTCSQRPHGSSTHLPTLLTTLQCGGKEYRRLSCHRRRPVGAVFTAQKMPSCKTEKGGGSQGTSPATPDMRRLIRATGIQRHGCCGACPCVQLTLAPMNASRNILQGKCSWPCRQSRVSSTFQQPLFGQGVALFLPFLPCAILA
ncbi:hypothetical protein TcCL_ESM10735 [Trypanosoma cruzi]|nr:hypothetical protein TcCL_ESM10735 [Trypanosoma cruzi]